MRFADPLWLLLAAVALPALVVWVLRRRWLRFPFSVGSAAPRRGRAAGAVTWSAGALAALTFILLAVALARPQEILARQLTRAEGVDLVVSLDVSGSMAALDFRPSDRLGVAKEVISDFLDRRTDDRIGVVVFAGAAVTVCPLTLDREVTRRLVDRISIGMLPDGTAIGMGLGTALTRLRDSEATSKVVVLVTDGSNNAGQLDPMTAAELAADGDVTVHTVLVGSGGEVPIPVSMRDPISGEVRQQIRTMKVDVNPELLAEIARTTGGTAFRARDADALEEVFAEIDRLERTEFTATRLVRYRELFGAWALAAGLLLATSVLGEGLAGRTAW